MLVAEQARVLFIFDAVHTLSLRHITNLSVPFVQGVRVPQGCAAHGVRALPVVRHPHTRQQLRAPQVMGHMEYASVKLLIFI